MPGCFLAASSASASKKTQIPPRAPANLHQAEVAEQHTADHFAHCKKSISIILPPRVALSLDTEKANLLDYLSERHARFNAQLHLQSIWVRVVERRPRRRAREGEKNLQVLEKVEKNLKTC